MLSNKELIKYLKAEDDLVARIKLSVPFEWRALIEHLQTYDANTPPLCEGHQLSKLVEGVCRSRGVGAFGRELRELERLDWEGRRVKDVPVQHVPARTARAVVRWRAHLRKGEGSSVVQFQGGHPVDGALDRVHAQEMAA